MKNKLLNRCNTIKKQHAFKCILDELHIPVIDLYLSKGSTVTRAGLREVYRVLDPSGPKNLLKHDVTKAILRHLDLDIQPYHFSKGSTVTKFAILEILEALKTRVHYSMAA